MAGSAGSPAPAPCSDAAGVGAPVALASGGEGLLAAGQVIVTRSLRNGVFSFRSGVIWHGLSLLGGPQLL